MSTSFPAGLKRSAAMVVLQHQTSFLLLRRNKAPHKNKYVPVGGKLEPYEDPYTAARRELHEETGLQVDQLRYGGVLIETSPVNYNWQCNIYITDMEDILPPYCDEGTLEWIDFDQLSEIPTPPTDWHIYQFLVQGRPFALNARYNADLQLLHMTEEITGEVLVDRSSLHQ